MTVPASEGSSAGGEVALFVATTPPRSVRMDSLGSLPPPSTSSPRSKVKVRPLVGIGASSPDSKVHSEAGSSASSSENDAAPSRVARKRLEDGLEAVMATSSEASSNSPVSESSHESKAALDIEDIANAIAAAHESLAAHSADNSAADMHEHQEDDRRAQKLMCSRLICLHAMIKTDIDDNKGVLSPAGCRAYRAIIKTLTSVCAHAATLSIVSCEQEHLRTATWGDLSGGLCAAHIAAIVMASKDIDPTMLSDELIDAVTALCKRSVSGDVAAAFDASDGPGATLDDDAVLKCSAIASRVGAILSLLAVVVSASGTADSTLLQVSAACNRAIFIAPRKSIAHRALRTVVNLQHKAADALCFIFSKFERHRIIIVDDILGNLSRIPASSKALSEAYAIPLPFDGGAGVRIVSALLLRLCQSCPSCSKANEKDSSAPFVLKYMLERLLSKCSTIGDAIDANSRKEHCGLLSMLSCDFLSLLHAPEFPASETMLHVLCNMLLAHLSTTKNSGIFENTCFDIVGKILSCAVARVKRCRDNPVVLPKAAAGASDSAEPDDEGEVIGCYCGQGYDGTLMLDCDACHRWFHGPCVGLRTRTCIPSVWTCDDCSLQKSLSAYLHRRRRVEQDVVDTSEAEQEDDKAAEKAMFAELILSFIASDDAIDDAKRGAEDYFRATWGVSKSRSTLKMWSSSLIRLSRRATTRVVLQLSSMMKGRPMQRSG